MLLAGEFVVEDVFDRDPVIYHRGRLRKPFICEGRSNPRWFYKIHDCYRDGVRYFRTISRNKLVWMVWNKKLIPPDHVIHHKDEDRFNDAINNLELLHFIEHNELHYGNCYEIPD